MKILYLEIENYGNLSNLTGARHVDFCGGLQEFREPNGRGKTTLCSFIRAIFYGLKSRRENDVSFGDREHYYPFSGGRFGGSVTFARAGKTCRIERFFDEKSATRDHFRYFENGEEIAADGDKIGKEIFGLDEEAFLRSLTFDAREAEISATDGMKERLGAIAEGIASGRNAAAAIEILEKRRKEICGDRKNADSETYRLDRERARLNAEAATLEDAAQAADGLYAARARLKAEIAAAEKEETAFSGAEALEEKRSRYAELVRQAKEADFRRAEIEARYPAGVVSEKEIERLRLGQTAIARLSGELSGMGCASAEKTKSGGRSANILLVAAVAAGVIALGLFLSKKLSSAAPAFCACALAAIAVILAAAKKPKRTKDAADGRKDEVRARYAAAKREISEIFEARRLRAPADFGTALTREIERLSGDLSAFKRYEEDGLRYSRRAAEYMREANLSAYGGAETAAGYGAQGGAGFCAADGADGSYGARARMAALKEALSAKRKELAGIERRIEEAEAAAERLEEKKCELYANMEKTENARYRLNIYLKTAEILRRADDSLMSRYSEPVRQRFLQYAALLENELGVEAYMNRDFSLSFSRGGARRSDGHLSAGGRSVCALCLRLALIDVMFAGRETPFLVLDDPFVHLDEERFARTARLVRELSKDRQIIYFTCHASRSIALQ